MIMNKKIIEFIRKDYYYIMIVIILLIAFLFVVGEAKSYTDRVNAYWQEQASACGCLVDSYDEDFEPFAISKDFDIPKPKHLE